MRARTRAATLPSDQVLPRELELHPRCRAALPALDIRLRRTQMFSLQDLQTGNRRMRPPLMVLPVSPQRELQQQKRLPEPPNRCPPPRELVFLMHGELRVFHEHVTLCWPRKIHLSLLVQVRRWLLRPMVGQVWWLKWLMLLACGPDKRNRQSAPAADCWNGPTGAAGSSRRRLSANWNGWVIPVMRLCGSSKMSRPTSVNSTIDS
mmetsp:Transcript_152126/g.276696  ORF Transcript_152126/g.276696 Transcript_152126/m.276696 type:complete len:206 (+) Transcript_152126:2925-3542(+)